MSVILVNRENKKIHMCVWCLKGIFLSFSLSVFLFFFFCVIYRMQEVFPVNSGNVPPPSVSTNLLSHQLAFNNNNHFQNNLKRKIKNVKSIPKLKLDRILGLTSISSNTLDTANDLIAYAAGAVAVLYNHKRNKQIAFLYPPPTSTSFNISGTSNISPVNNTNNPNNSIAQPLMIPIGNIASNNEHPTTNLTEEKKGITPASTRAKTISCLAFSPDGKYLAVGEVKYNE
ncbi:hypothetical protein BCV72DRAFT_74875 [Rhizopus microsporus var. microsporus]|uniref:Uncharacterized protein n=1 Tax=Rhizopus microsporus var. microsporus TaxID=86635 RepID=A0A1X0RAA3_RHIZD|nr:hypothetical protein BCV72DRAFT_74875 [Rhizopus microsporus var. microsporus]